MFHTDPEYNWEDAGIRREFHGTLIRFNVDGHTGMPVHNKPSEVWERMRSSSEDMIELEDLYDPTLKVYADRRLIVSLNPMWKQVS